MDDINLYVWLPELKTLEAVWREMQASVDEWGRLLIATGGALKPEKCYWYNVDYVWDDKGAWHYASTIHQDLHVPLPDGLRAKIKHLGVDNHEKILGIFSCPQGDNLVYLSKQVIESVWVWTTRMSNRHLL